MRARRRQSSYVCLVSNAAPEQFPANTETNFTNPLPSPVQNRYDRRFQLRLCSIAVGRTIDPEYARLDTSHLKVHIAELYGEWDGTHTTRVIGTFPYPPAKTVGDYGHHTFRLPPTLGLRYRTLDTLSVRITTLDGEEVRFENGFPTLAWMELSEWDADDHFTVTCSDSHPDYFPGNQPHRFRSPLPREMLLEGYEVALQQCIFPSTLTQRENVAVMRVNGHEFRYDLTRLDSNFWLVWQVQHDLSNSPWAGDLIFELVPPPMRNAGSARVARRPGVDPAPLTLDFSPEFARVCGQDSRPANAVRLGPGDVYVFDGRPNVAGSRPSPLAILTCDLIRPNVVGGRQERALQLVPVLGEDRGPAASNVYEPENLSFHEVVSKPISSIGFTITEPDGRMKTFETRRESDRFHITLTFRKRPLLRDAADDDDDD